LNRKYQEAATPTGLVKVLVALPAFRKQFFGEILARELRYLGQMIVFDVPSAACSWVEKPTSSEKFESLHETHENYVKKSIRMRTYHAAERPYIDLHSIVGPKDDFWSTQGERADGSRRRFLIEPLGCKTSYLSANDRYRK